MNTTETPTINSNTSLAAPSLPLEQPSPKSAIAAHPPSTNSASLDPESGIRNLQSKIERLPKATRDMLNLMLDDGLPYHVILDELGDTAQGVSAGGLAKWTKGGYEDYLKERQATEEVKSEAEFAADFLRELGSVDATVIHRACHVLVSLQMFRAIRKLGDEALRDMLRAKPSSYLNLLNTLCNMVQPTIDLENHRIAVQKAHV